MGALGVLEVVLALLQGVATALGKTGLATQAAGVQAAIDSLTQVHGSLVTESQVQSLKITPQW